MDYPYMKTDFEFELSSLIFFFPVSDIRELSKKKWTIFR
jgi:hypothetical protein